MKDMRALWKLPSVWLLFLALHFSYETFPNPLFKLIGEEGETTFFHMKMLFFAYVFVSLVEWALRRKKVTSPRGFLTTRAFIAVVYPWITITIWFSAEAMGFAFPDLVAELIYANVVTAIGIYIALRLEDLLDGVDIHRSVSVMMVMVFAFALLSYSAFSFTEPMPFFETPAGLESHGG